MKFSRLIFANLFRKKIRLILTIGSFAVALFLFSFLAVVKGAFGRGAAAQIKQRGGGLGDVGTHRRPVDGQRVRDDRQQLQRAESRHRLQRRGGPAPIEHDDRAHDTVGLLPASGLARPLWP